MQSITPFLWFNGEAEEATSCYVSVFKDAKVLNVSRVGDPDAPVFSTSFELLGQEFHALNGGSQYRFTPATSFFVSVETQEEVDYYWSRLTEGGEEQPCGWLVDRFGVSWQIIPEVLGGLIAGPDPEKRGRAMQAMLQMRKIDIAALQRAYDGA